MIKLKKISINLANSYATSSYSYNRSCRAHDLTEIQDEGSSDHITLCSRMRDSSCKSGL